MSALDNSPNLSPILRAHINRIAKEEGFINYTFEQNAGSAHGDGFMATMISITIQGQRHVNREKQDDTLSLICKLLPDSMIRQKQFSTSQIFEREVQFYSSALPRLLQFQQEKGLTAENGFSAYCRCYAASSDCDRNEFVIILKDLRSNGYSLWDKLKPIEFGMVNVLMEQMGRMHGLSFAMREQRPEAFKPIESLEAISLSITKVKALIDMFESGFDLAITVLALEEDIQLMRRLKRTFTEWLDENLHEDAARPFNCFTHGDCWNNNLMFTTSPVQVCILDWQVCRFVSPALDISLFLLTSTQKDLRALHYDQFIQIYYRNVAETIRKCGSDPEKLFSFEDLQGQLKKFGVFGVYFMPTVLQILVTDPSGICDMNVMAENIDSNDDGSKDFAKFDEKAKERYRQRLTDGITDARKYGWI